MKVTSEEIKKLESWLNSTNKMIGIETDIDIRRQINSKYLGAIKLVDKLKGSIRFYSNERHDVKLPDIPEQIEISELSTFQLIGSLEIMYSAGLNPRLQYKVITFGRT